MPSPIQAAESFSTAFGSVRKSGNEGVIAALMVMPLLLVCSKYSIRYKEKNKLERGNIFLVTLANG